MPRENSTDLLRKCAAQSDPELWRQFLDRFGSRLLIGVQRALYRYDVRPRIDEQEDLLQEVYCRLLDRRGRHLRRCISQSDAGIGAYLSRIAESVVVDQLRASAAAKRGGGVLFDPSAAAESDIGAMVIDPALTPEERLLALERCQNFMILCRRAVGGHAPQRDLTVLYLAFFEGCTSREICRRLGQGLTPSTIDSLVHRLKKRLLEDGVEMARRLPTRTPRSSIGRQEEIGRR